MLKANCLSSMKNVFDMASELSKSVASRKIPFQLINTLHIRIYWVTMWLWRATLKNTIYLWLIIYYLFSVNENQREDINATELIAEDDVNLVSDNSGNECQEISGMNKNLHSV